MKCTNEGALPIHLPTAEYLTLIRAHQAAVYLSAQLERERHLSDAVRDALNSYNVHLSRYNAVRQAISDEYGSSNGWHHVEKPKRETWEAGAYRSETLMGVVAWCAERGLTLSRWYFNKKANASWAIHRGEKKHSLSNQTGLLATGVMRFVESRFPARADKHLEKLRAAAMEALNAETS